MVRSRNQSHDKLTFSLDVLSPVRGVMKREPHVSDWKYCSLRQPSCIQLTGALLFLQVMLLLVLLATGTGTGTRSRSRTGGTLCINVPHDDKVNAMRNTLSLFLAAVTRGDKQIIPRSYRRDKSSASHLLQQKQIPTHYSLKSALTESPSHSYTGCTDTGSRLPTFSVLLYHCLCCCCCCFTIHCSHPPPLAAPVAAHFIQVTRSVCINRRAALSLFLLHHLTASPPPPQPASAQTCVLSD